MRKLRLTLTIIATMFVFGANAQTVQEVQTKFKEAAQLYNEKKYTEAIPLFEEVVTMGDMAEDDVADMVSNAQKYIYLSNMSIGRQTAKSGDFRKAADYFRSAENSTTSILEKNNAAKVITACYSQMANKEIKADNMEGAAAIADERYTENSRDIKMGLIAAQCYMKAGNVERATVIYDDLIKLGETPRYENAAKTAKESAAKDMLSNAIRAINSKDLTNALVYLDLGSKYDEKSPIIAMARIQVYNDMKQYKKVVEYGEKAVAAQPDEMRKASASFFVAIAHQELGNKAKAIEYYKQVTVGSNSEVAKKLVEQLSKQE